MPRDLVTGQDAEDVAAYVATVAGLDDQSAVRPAPPRDLPPRYGDPTGKNRAAPFAVLQIEYTLLDAHSPTLAVHFRNTYSARVAAASGSPEAIVNSWTEALIQVLSELEVDLQRATSR